VCSIDARLCVSLAPLVVGEAAVVHRVETQPSSATTMRALLDLGLDFWSACADVRNDNNAIMRIIGLAVRFQFIRDRTVHLLLGQT